MARHLEGVSDHASVLHCRPKPLLLARGETRSAQVDWPPVPSAGVLPRGFELLPRNAAQLLAQSRQWRRVRVVVDVLARIDRAHRVAGSGAAGDVGGES